MNDKEKLVAMINHVCEGHAENLMQPYGVETLADHLIANGVTVPTDMPTCGDCIHCDECSNNERLTMFSPKNVAYCKKFEPREKLKEE